MESSSLGPNGNRSETMKCFCFSGCRRREPCHWWMQFLSQPYKFNFAKDGRLWGVQGYQPGKLTETFRYFLWGAGYVLSSIMSQLTALWIYLISNNAGCTECPISWPVTTNQLRIQDSSECTNALDRHQSGEVSSWTDVPPWSHTSPSFRWPLHKRTFHPSLPLTHGHWTALC